MQNAHWWSERFWKFASKGDTGECWPWKGPALNSEYGVFRVNINGKISRTTAHRASFILRFGELKDNEVIHHLCGNKKCINPEHLEAMSRAEHARLHDNLAGQKGGRRGPGRKSDQFNSSLNIRLTDELRDWLNELYPARGELSAYIRGLLEAEFASNLLPTPIVIAEKLKVVRGKV